jgi:uncharacterized membrane protein
MKLKPTKFQVVLEIVGLLLITAFIVFLFISWDQIPSKIPGHYNAKGVVDRYGSKNEIIALPVIGIFFYVFFTVIILVPAAWGIPVKTTASNMEKIYDYTRTLLIIMKLEVVSIFFYLAYNMAAARPLPAMFTPILLLIIAFTLVYYLIKILKTGKKG